MKFSIVIPAYNRGNHIKRTIDSVLKQELQDFEIIVVNDGSTDNTLEVVQSIKDPRISIYTTENRERGAARNHGASKAKGEYVYFLDSDDILYPHHLITASRIIAKEAPSVFFQRYEIIDTITNKKYQPIFLKGSLNDSLIEKGNFLSCHGVFLKREVTQDFLFIEDRALSGSEDYEYWLRIICDFEIKYTNEITSALLNHEERSVLNMDEEKLINRMESFFFYLKKNKRFQDVYGEKIKIIHSNFFQYISLHLVLSESKNRKLSFNYLFKSIATYPFSLFNRRTFGILKNMIV